MSARAPKLRQQSAPARNLLVGGSNKHFTLQPLSVQAQTGVNLAVGIADFRLRTAAG